MIRCLPTLLIIACLACFGCDRIITQKNAKRPQRNLLQDSLAREQYEKDSFLVVYKQQVWQDSLACEKLYAKGVDFWRKNKHTSSFIQKIGKDSLYLEWGNIFSPYYKHLLMMRKTHTKYKLDILLPRQDSLLSQFQHWHDGVNVGVGTPKDTLFDVDGDGWRDYAQTFYGMNGCCLKNYYTFYMFREDSCKFASKILLTNPTFYPQERVVRGVGYGYPGQVRLYKNAWINKALVNIESIAPNPNDYHIFYRYNAQDQLIATLPALPAEYAKIYGIDWFLMYQKKKND